MKKRAKLIIEEIRVRSKPIATVSLLSLLLVTFQNCQESSEFNPVNKAKSIGIVEVVKPGNELCKDNSSDDLICNPLGGGSFDENEQPAVPVERLGLVGNVIEGDVDWNHLDRYLNEGYRHNEMVYFSNFNIPQRSFSEGFGNGSFHLENRFGEKLIEWFAIHVSGNITLPLNEESGYFHIASASDDGIKINIDGKTILSNPVTHGVTLDCASELIYIEKGEEKPLELFYFQGPRHHIALMTLVKRVNDPDAFKLSKSCGKSSKDAKELINEGYKVMGPSWFTLPY